MATRLGGRFTEHLFTECGRRSGFEFANVCTTKRGHEPARVPRRTQQVRGFHKPDELGCRNQSDVARPSSSYDYRVLLIYHLVEHGGQVRAKSAISRFTRHAFLDFYCTEFLYVSGFTRS
jgi:hypothetical protein